MSHGAPPKVPRSVPNFPGSAPNAPGSVSNAPRSKDVWDGSRNEFVDHLGTDLLGSLSSLDLVVLHARELPEDEYQEAPHEEHHYPHDREDHLACLWSDRPRVSVSVSSVIKPGNVPRSSMQRLVVAPLRPVFVCSCKFGSEIMLYDEKTGSPTTSLRCVQRGTSSTRVRTDW